jgi:hypothetical protein
MLKSFRPVLLSSALVLALAVGAAAPVLAQGAGPAKVEGQISNGDIDRIQNLLSAGMTPEILGAMSRLSSESQDALRMAFRQPTLAAQNEALAKLFDRLTPLQQVGYRNVLAGLAIAFPQDGAMALSFMSFGSDLPGIEPAASLDRRANFIAPTPTLRLPQPRVSGLIRSSAGTVIGGVSEVFPASGAAP